LVVNTSDVTLIIPTRNEARNIAAFLASVPDHVQLIVVDSSADHTPELVETLRPHNSTVIRQQCSVTQDRRLIGWGQGAAHALGIPAVSGSNLLVRRDVFWDAGGFDLELTCNEDSELGWRLKRRGFRVGFVPDLIVYARDHCRLRRRVYAKTNAGANSSGKRQALPSEIERAVRAARQTSGQGRIESG
jgi:GT2 family glycosyltransferase